MTFAAVLARWPDIECDLQDGGVDVGDPEVMTGRTWRWLRVRIEGILTRPILAGPTGGPVFQSRLQAALFQPAADAAAAEQDSSL